MPTFTWSKKKIIWVHCKTLVPNTKLYKIHYQDFQQADSPNHIYQTIPKIMILRFIWKGKRTKRTKTILKKNKFGLLTLLNFRTWYEVTVIKTAWECKRAHIPINKAESTLLSAQAKPGANSFYNNSWLSSSRYILIS